MFLALQQQPKRRLLARVLLALLRAYRAVLSPWLGNACRFEPTCSRYAIEAIERHGAEAGFYLGARRLLRCHPWCEGGCDPVPEMPPRRFFSSLFTKANSSFVSRKTPS